MWAENFQDLSLFCQEDSPSLARSASIARGNSIVQDDELNTPDIDYEEEFNFDSWNKPESFDDNNLWDDTPLPRIGIDNDGDGSILDAEKCEDLPDETNPQCINLDSNVDKNHSEDGLYLSAYANCQYEKMHNIDEIQMQEEVDCEFIKSNATLPAVTEEEKTQTELNSPLPAKLSAKASLHLPLTFENAADVLNTPDVLARLDPQPGFDLLRFVLGENGNLVQPVTGAESVQSTEICGIEDSFEVKQEVEEVAEIVVPLQSTEGNVCDDLATCAVSCLGPEADQPQQYVIVTPANEVSSRFCVVIKKGKAGSLISQTSSIKTEEEEEGGCEEECRRAKKRKKRRPRDFSDEDSSDDEYVPPTKAKKRSTSPRAQTSQCSRYRELRDRNNEASRRSRQNRKEREKETKVQAEELEADNRRLRIKADELEKLVDTLRKALLAAMVKGKG